MLCLAATCVRGQAPAVPAGLYGQPVAGIAFEPRTQPLTRDQLGLLLRIQPGDGLDELELSQAIERLWASGRFRDIKVEAERRPEGVELTFHTTPALFVGRVTVDGVPEPPSPSQTSGATKLVLGEPYSDELLPQATAGLMSLLHANGFFGASVSYESATLPDTEEMNVRFVVDAGRRARLVAPQFTGDARMKESRLAALTGWQRWYGLRGWKEMNQSLVQRGVERLRDAYRKAGHLRAEIRIAGLDYDASSGTVRPRLEVDAGPMVTVKVSGAKVSGGNLRRLIPIYQERTVDRELLLEGQRNLEQHFHGEGFFDAKVTYSLAAPGTGGEQTIRYNIERGQRYKLVHVKVEGNGHFGLRALEDRLSIMSARWPRYRRGVFSPALFEQDQQSLADLYRAAGFRDVEVKGRIERGWQGKALEVAAVFSIKEGPRYQVADLELTGVDLTLFEKIRSMVRSQPGQPFSVANMAADRDTVLGWYFNNGYPEASFDATVAAAAAEPYRMKLRYSVREGRRLRVRGVLVRGLEATRPELVLNRLAMHAQQPLSQGGIVETQRRLYDLGIFAKVDVAVQNPEGRERDKYVLLNLEEASKYSVTVGGGAEMGRIGGGSNFTSPAGSAGFAPRGQIGITRSNIFGIGHTASATIRVSNIQQRLVASYLAPHFLDSDNYNLTFSSLVDRSRDVRTYTSSRSESAAQLGQKLSPALSIQYRVTTRFVFIDRSTLKIDPTLIPVFSQPVKTLAVSSSIIYDKRDDPVESRRGYNNTLDVGYAPKFSGSSTHYTRLVARNSTYHPFLREAVFARSTSFGWLHNHDSDPVPLPENFYAGGASTHRGFPDNQAGPRDLVTGFPIGGQAFLFFQHELRFPLIGRTVGGVIFHDMGNVYSDLDNLSFRFRQRDRHDFDYMVQAGGVGVRVKTPVGPLRVDFAYAPNSPRFVGFNGTQDQLIAGTGQYNVPQRVNPFQFHFFDRADVLMLRLTLTLVALAGLLRAGEVLDRVAVAVGRQVVTLSAVRRQLRMEALMGNGVVEDNAAARRAAAERLVDQTLIRQELELSGYAGPAMAEADARIAADLKERKLEPEQLPALLGRYGFSEDEYRRQVLWQLRVARFIDFRFAPGVQISDSEIEAFYSTELLPKLPRAEGARPPRLDEVRDRIVRVLSVRKTNAAVEEWLKQARAQAKLEWFEEALR